ncbi:MAG: DUF366 family protein [Bdellovibrionales bacterium]|nr:DUF366 family protein [Bdellovibrionales bacterium]
MRPSGITTHWDEREREYRGPELRPHFVLATFGVKGSALAAFEGPCRVDTEHLVDWEDRLASDRIEARRMIHFLGEFFGVTLAEGVWIQRLFMSIVGDRLARRLATAGRWSVRREGDDLFVAARGGSEERKLSVSIVTASPVSLLLHAGINIDPAGAPVPAVGLAELGVEAPAFARECLEAFAEEWRGVEWACVKVRPVG